MPGRVLQQNTLYSGLLITDKQDRINEKIMLKFFFKTGIFHEFKYNHQSANTDTEYKQTEIYYTMPSRRNSKTLPVKYLIERGFFYALK